MFFKQGQNLRCFLKKKFSLPAHPFQLSNGTGVPYFVSSLVHTRSSPAFMVCRLVRSHLSSSTVPKKYVQKLSKHAGADTFFTPCLYFHALKSEAQVTCQVWEMTDSNKQQAAKKITHPPKILLRYVDSAGCLPDMMSLSQCRLRLPFSFHFSL